MERIWLKNYQSGVATDINPDQYPSLNAMLGEALTKYKDLPAFSNMGRVMSYGELEADARAFAGFLQNNLKLTKGDRVALMLPNVLQYPVAMLGTLLAGCVVVNVNPLYTADELEYQLKDSEAVAIVVLENFAHTLADVIDRTKVQHAIIAKVGDVFPSIKANLINFVIKYIKRMVPAWNLKSYYWYKDALLQGRNAILREPVINNTDLAFLQYTGGTTGKAKGAMLTHRNMVANVLQNFAWASQTLIAGKEIVITPLPLYHIYGLTAGCLSYIVLGSMIVLITNPRDISGFIKDLKKHKFTTLTGINTLYNLLLNNSQIDTVDFSSLKFSPAGGMAVQRVVAERWNKLTNSWIVEGYGLTESSPVICANPVNIKEYNGSVGLPYPSTEISIRNEQDIEVPIGESGELLVRGPQVMLGYWRHDEETKKVITADGWLRTGDMATIDERGFLRIVDRKKDLINVSGFKVIPNEVEGVISSMPGVLEVAVIGVQDPAQGEMVKAFIVKKDPTLTEKQVKDYCHEHLTGYKVPKLIEFAKSLPKSNVGKVLRRALKESERNKT